MAGKKFCNILLFIVWNFQPISSDCLIDDDYTALCAGEGYTSIPTTFSQNIETLILSENKLSELNEATLLQYSKVSYFKIDTNSFTTSMDLEPIRVLRDLVYLDISRNDFVIFDLNDLAYNRNLKKLIVDDNHHLKLSPRSTRLTSMEEISLNHCNLDHLELEFFEGLVNLRRIQIRDNLLEYLPDLLKVLPNLKIIQLSGNPLATLDPRIARLSDLPSFHVKTRSVEPTIFIRHKVEEDYNVTKSDVKVKVLNCGKDEVTITNDTQIQVEYSSIGVAVLFCVIPLLILIIVILIWMARWKIYAADDYGQIINRDMV